MVRAKQTDGLHLSARVHGELDIVVSILARQGGNADSRPDSKLWTSPAKCGDYDDVGMKVDLDNWNKVTDVIELNN